MTSASMQQTSSIIPTVTGNIYPTNDAVRREVTVVSASTNTWPEECVEVKYSDTRVVGNGSFGKYKIFNFFNNL